MMPSARYPKACGGMHARSTRYRTTGLQSRGTWPPALSVPSPCWASPPPAGARGRRCPVLRPAASAGWYRLGRWWADVAGSRPDEPVVGGLFHHVSGPADDPAGGEGGCEHVARDPAGVHDHSGEELDVGVEPASGLQLGEHVDGGLLDLLGELDQGAAERGGHLTEEARARVVGLVDAVTEAHYPIAPRHRFADPPLGPVGGADAVQHVERAARRATVQLARQGADGPTDCGGQVGTGRGDDPGREGGGVESVVDGQHQVPVSYTHLTLPT